MSVFWLKSESTVKFSLSLWEITRALPSGFPLCSGYISPYIPPLVIIQIQYYNMSEEGVVNQGGLKGIWIIPLWSARFNNVPLIYFPWRDKSVNIKRYVGQFHVKVSRKKDNIKNWIWWRNRKATKVVGWFWQKIN